MPQPAKDFCFCTLALGVKYRLLAKQLAADLAIHAPGISLVVGTDAPQDFQADSNILPFEHHWQGILTCYHDKRFVVKKALESFRVAVNVDADTRIMARVPQITWAPGIIGRRENLLEHVQKYNPERLNPIQDLASKLGVSLATVSYIGESLFIVVRDAGRETEFIKQWGKIGRYLELKGIHSGEGNAMGLAAAAVGWSVRSEGWQQLNQVRRHLDASDQANSVDPTTSSPVWDPLKQRLAYHYRLTQARLIALQQFNFYYR